MLSKWIELFFAKKKTIVQLKQPKWACKREREGKREVERERERTNISSSYKCICRYLSTQRTHVACVYDLFLLLLCLRSSCLVYTYTQTYHMHIHHFIHMFIYPKWLLLYLSCKNRALSLSLSHSKLHRVFIHHHHHIFIYKPVLAANTYFFISIYRGEK